MFVQLIFFSVYAVAYVQKLVIHVRRGDCRRTEIVSKKATAETSGIYPIEDLFDELV